MTRASHSPAALWPSRAGCSVAAALVLLYAAAARAEQPLWELGFGVGALHLPHYRGSAQSHDWLLPVPYFVYRGDILRADRNGARALLFADDRFDIDLSLAASAPTRSRDNQARAGMRDLSPTLEIGPNLNLTLARGAGWKLDARLPLRAVVALGANPAGLGWTASPVINLDLDWQRWNVGLQGGPLAATRRNHAYFYSVGPADATPARPAYDAPGGGAGWRVLASASRRVGDFWLAGFVRHDSVAGAAFDPSPLVTQQRHVSYGVALSWIFKVSQQHVPDAR